MQHETPTWLLPYPDSQETANVPRDLQALSEAADAALTQVGQSSGVPVGAILMWAAELPPARYMICDGAQLTVDESTQELFAVISNLYGGDGVSTFNLPDLQARVPVGVNDTAIAGPPARSVRQAGQTGGEEAHKQIASEVASHTHGYGDVQPYRSGSRDIVVGSSPNYDGVQSINETSFANQAQGTVTPANVMQPFLVVNFVIKFTSA